MQFWAGRPCTRFLLRTRMRMWQQSICECPVVLRARTYCRSTISLRSIDISRKRSMLSRGCLWASLLERWVIIEWFQTEGSEVVSWITYFSWGQPVCNFPNKHTVSSIVLLSFILILVTCEVESETELDWLKLPTVHVLNSAQFSIEIHILASKF